jgi:hypothetical protein
MISGKVITIGLEQTKHRLQDLVKKINKPGDGFLVAGRAIGNELKKHFREKNQKPNKQGFTKSGFWAQMRDSVQVIKLGEGAVVQVNDPRFNQKVYGGTITPKTTKALAIPLANEFYGVRPSTFGDRFFFIPRKKGKMVGLLAEHLSDKSIRVAYVLMSSVTQDADADALPPLDELERVAVKALEGWVSRQLQIGS